jgi:Tfp pilus assembly PilM family ATPase
LLPDDEITSTEQLLTLIRKNDVQNDVALESPVVDLPKQVHSETDNVTIALDIRENEIILVKIAATGKDSWKLIDCQQNVFPSVDTDSEVMSPKSISNYVKNFIGDTKNYRLWAFVSSEKADVKQILIPKVQEKMRANSIFWTAKKEMAFDEELTYINYELIGDITQKGIGKTAAMVYTIPKKQISSLKELFINAGFPLTGLSIPEFSTQNLLRGDLLPGSGDTIATLCIGQSYSKISVYRHGYLTLTRKIKACLNSMSESLVEKIKESYATGMQSNQMFSLDYARNLLLKNISQSWEPDNIDDDNLIDQNQIFSGVLPAVERLVRQIERTFQHYNTLFSEDLITLLYIEGPVCRFKTMTQFISKELDINVSHLDVVKPGIPQFVAYLEHNPINCGAHLTPAVGLAMSDFQESAPNYLFDYLDKERMKLNTRVNKGIRIGLTIATILCFCLLFFQIIDSRQNKNEIKSLKERLTAYGPRVDQNLILQEAARMKNLYKSQKKIAEKYLGLATITELIERNPNYIQLNQIRLNLGSLAIKKRRVKPDKHVIIEGMVFKEKAGQRGRDIFETSLANYILALEKSPIFINPSIREKSFEHIDRFGEILVFELKVQIQSQSDNME